MTLQLLMAAALMGGPGDSPLAPAAAGRELVCRGYEDSGNITEDQPMWPAHLVSLFVTGKDPRSPGCTMVEHVAWVNDPAHSYLDDGTGGLVVWAHPGEGDAEAMLALPGLAGMELTHGGDSVRRERLWDCVLTGCRDAGRPFLWGFAADDTHSRRPDRIGLSFLVVRLPEFSERALKQALRAGAFYASNGPLIGDIRVEGATISLTLPADCEVRWLKSGQFGVGAPAVVGAGPGENHCLKRDAGVRSSRYTLNDADGTTDAKAARFVRAVVIAGTAADGRVAHTMPFAVRSADRLDNPYPAAGGWFRGQTHNHCDTTGGKRTPIVEFHRAYQSAGHHWTFGTDYGYWLTPFQRHPDTLAVVTSVSPDRGPSGRPTRVVIRGRLFGPGATVRIGGRSAEEVKWFYEDRLEATAPADLPVGSHDVTVADGGWQDTLPLAFTVQQAGAENAGWTTWTTANSELPGDQTFCLCVPPAGPDAVWVGTQFGAARFDGKVWHPVTRHSNELMGDAILTVAADRAGSVWFGHFRGLTRLRPDGTWQIFRTEDGLPSREVNRVFIDSRDELWMTYNGRSAQLSHFDGKTWQHLTPPNAAGQRMSLAVCEDDAGRILVAPRKSGLALLDRKTDKWDVWTTANSGLPDDFVRHVRKGSDGALHVATTSMGEQPAGGLAILRDGKWTVHGQGHAQGQAPSKPGLLEAGNPALPNPTAPGLAHYRVWDVLVDRRGHVWCVTTYGASRLAPDGTWRTFTTRNSGLAFDFVMGLAEDADGAIWLATARGVSRFRASGR